MKVWLMKPSAFCLAVLAALASASPSMAMTLGHHWAAIPGLKVW